MKKYITIAALLAAGTAFANAAEGDWEITFGSGYDNGYNLEGSLGNFSISDFTYSEDGAIITNSRILMTATSFGSFADNFEFSIEFTLANPIEGDSIQGSNKWPVFAELQHPGSTMFRFGPYIEENNVVHLDGHTAENSVTTHNVRVTAGERYTVTFTKIDSALTVKVGDQTAVTGTILTGKDTQIIKSVGLGGRVEGENAFVLAGTVHSVSYSVIPEPSAFGLLAGIGALALVASRRRRK